MPAKEVLLRWNMEKFTMGRVRKIRKALGISRKEFGRILCVKASFNPKFYRLKH
jgi:DNA-binding transcriptional regulator YiaG